VIPQKPRANVRATALSRGKLNHVIVGIGVDAVDVARMRQILERTPSFRVRTFTDDERAYCEQMNDPSERFAVRFAAKEAVMKAMGLGLGSFGFYDCETVVAESGAPSLVLRGPALDHANERGITNWHVTLTHTAITAVAMVVAENRSL
jgi:holo-[acyl-carrier protein] synthase